MIRDKDNSVYSIKARLGVPFGLPNLGKGQFEIEDTGLDGVHYSRGYELQIDGFGVGSLEVIRDPRYFMDKRFTPRRALPLGSVNVEMEFTERGVEVAYQEQLPLTFQVVLEELNDQRLVGLGVTLTSPTSKKLYTGRGMVGLDDEEIEYGLGEPLEEAAIGPAELAVVSFKNWNDSRTGEEKVPFWSVEQVRSDRPLFVVEYNPLVGDRAVRKRLSDEDQADLRLSNRFLDIFPIVHPDNK